MSGYYPYPKRDPIKNYFPLPNEIFLLGLTPGELAVYSYLMRCEDRKTHQCHPSYRTIGKAVQLSPNTVAKHVNGLREKRLITTENTEIVDRHQARREAKRDSPLYDPSSGGSVEALLRAADESARSSQRPGEDPTKARRARPQTGTSGLGSKIKQVKEAVP